jgi:DNA helicase HerA-like ATPase
MLVSQRPADVESTVISQCGTWLVLRLTKAADQQHVARFLPDGLSGMTRVAVCLPFGSNGTANGHMPFDNSFIAFISVG